jgi:hypothetical protein
MGDIAKYDPSMLDMNNIKKDTLRWIDEHSQGL